ncbi:MAG TPA: aminotransferase class V-fold PLP-dependent enzyme, partial [Baekduia sp.]|nr:aminotransferase class V-fold PLP-dependent enzyme [Baekduia sp.]
PAALVSVTGASNVTGELLPIAEIVEIAHRHGARVAVDGAQLIPHGEIDLAETGVDYLAFSGHKVYAPFGAGVLAGRRDWLDAAPPYLPGGGAVHEVSTVQTKWASAPQRHEGGTPNLVGAATLADALTTLARIPLERRAAHERALHARLEAGLSAIDGVRLPRIWSDSERIGVVCFSGAGYEPGHVASYLSAEHAIGVRDGRFCAHPLVRRLDLDHEGALRASLGVGSWRGDVDRIVGAVGQLVDQGSRARYEQIGGLWEPRGDDRRAPSWLVGDISAARPSPCGAICCSMAWAG